MSRPVSSIEPMRTTSIQVSIEDIDKAKSLGINIADEFRKYLKLIIAEAQIPKEISPEVSKEIADFVSAINNSKTNLKTIWKSLVTGRIRLIKNRTNILLSPEQLIEEVEKRLSYNDTNNKS
jgi:hypothetical protein